MWLLPPDFPLRPLRLAPDHRALPWYATEREIEQLMELLRRMVPEIREWVRVPWSALGMVSGRSEVREGAALMVEAPEDLDEAEARAIVAGVRWPYVFWRPPEPSEKHGAWLEREVKRALLSELRQGLASEEHPLRGLGIDRLSVDHAAAATDDPVDLLAIVHGAVTHRLSHADRGLRAEDWNYSVRQAIGQRLAARLGQLDDEKLTGVLRLMFSDGLRPFEGHADAGHSLQVAGLGVCVGESVALGPLARQAEDPLVRGVLLEQLLDQRHIPFDTIESSESTISLGSQELIWPPVTRIAGPVALYHWILGTDALDALEAFAKAASPDQSTSLKLDLLAKVVVSFLASGGRLVVDELTRQGKTLMAPLLRTLDAASFPTREQEQVVGLLRTLAELHFQNDEGDLNTFRRRIDDGLNTVKTLEPTSVPVGSAAILKLVIAYALLYHRQRTECYDEVLRFFADERQYVLGPEDENSSIADHLHFNLLRGSWSSLVAEVLRLRGDSLEASEMFNIVVDILLDHVARFALQPWYEWSLGRSRREGGYTDRAAASFSQLLAVRARDPEAVSERLHAHILLEQGHIAIEHANHDQAYECYHRSGQIFLEIKDEHMACYAEVFAIAAQRSRMTRVELVTRLEDIRQQAEKDDEIRLGMLVQLVLGDAEARRGGFDAAIEHYSIADALAVRCGDTIASSSVLEKLAYVFECLGIKQTAVTNLVRAAEIDTAHKRHWSAAKLLRRASVICEQEGRTQDAREYTRRAAEEESLAAQGTGVLYSKNSIGATLSEETTDAPDDEG